MFRTPSTFDRSTLTHSNHRRRSTVWLLVLLYTLLIAYASLYPFHPWGSKGMAWWSFLVQPLPKYWTWFDISANMLGYIPLGFLATWAALRDGNRLVARQSVLIGVLWAFVLSFCAETTQNYLPLRVASNLDLALNAAGGVLGATAAWILARLGALHFFGHILQRWIAPDTRFALILVLIWPWALLYPQPVAFGLGHVQERLENWLGNQLAGSPLVEWLPWHAIEPQPLLHWQVLLVVAIAVWLPCLLLYLAVPHWKHRLPIAIVILIVGVLAHALGHALARGPENAWGWLWQPVQHGLLLGAACAVLSGFAPRWLSKLLILLLLLIQLPLLNDAAISAYYDNWQTQTWLPGQFIRFYGITRWLGWLWSWVVLLYIIVQIAMLLRKAEGQFNG